MLCFLGQDLSLNWSLPVGLSGWPMSHVNPPVSASQSESTGIDSHAQVFTWVLEIHTQVLILVQQVIHLWRSLLSPIVDFFPRFIFLIVCVDVLCACMSVHHLHATLKEAGKRTLDFPELDL